VWKNLNGVGDGWMCFHDCNRDYEQKREQEVSRAAHCVAVKVCAERFWVRRCVVLILWLRFASEGNSKREFMKMKTDKEKSEQKCVRVRFCRLIQF